MPLRARIWKSFYQDSVVLMRTAAELRALPGVREAAALMGTPANHELLAAAGLATSETRTATPTDLIVAVDAADDAAAEAALATGQELFEQRRRSRESTGTVLPRTLDSALRQMPDANLVMISVPGEYAKLEALGALRRGLHVFLFSDNVSLEDEVELKQLAARQGLFCMGPDCGTAYVNGVGLGFANVVPRGRIGCVAASGTGLQAVASHLAALGEGISHGIGVGGRDLSAEVGGAMTTQALDALSSDPSTEAVVVISKPPAPAVVEKLDAAIRSVAKPVIVCLLGATPRSPRDLAQSEPAASRSAHDQAPSRSRSTWVSTLEDAAEAAAASVRATAWTPRAFTDATRIRERLSSLTARGSLLGLYTGGTLAYESRHLLEPLIGPVGGNVGGAPNAPHRIVDLGADEFTRGHPHPMIDPSVRDARLREATKAADVGVLLVDVVLGRAAHPDPARSLSAAIRDVRAAAERDGRSLVAIASIVGTEGDPQGLRAQSAALEAAGVHLLPSNAQAARFAALVLRPDLASRLLGEAR